MFNSFIGFVRIFSEGRAMKSSCGLCALLLLFMYGDTHAANTEEKVLPSFEKIWAEIASNREKLNSLTMSIKAISPKVPAQYSGYEEAVRQYDVKMLAAEGMLKFEMKWLHPRDTWTAKTLVNPDEILLDPGGWAPHANLSSRQHEDVENLLRFTFDPKVVGLACRPLVEIQRTTLATLRTQFLKCSKSYISMVNDETMLAELEFTGGFIELHIVPENGYAVTKIKKKGAVNGIIESVESRYARLETPSGFVWFPDRVEYNRSKNGEIDFKEVITIGADANVQFAKSDFGLSSLGLAEGRRVFTDERRAMVWRNGRLSQATRKDMLDRETGNYMDVGTANSVQTERLKNERYWLRPLLLLNSVIAVGFVVWVCFIRNRTRREG